MSGATREEWAKRVTRWKDSGLTAKEFASEIGVSPHSLSWWRWKLGTTHSSGTANPRLGRRGPRARAKRSSAAISPLTFVEMPAAIEGAALELVVLSKIRVRVPAGFDEVTLRRLLDVLEARR